MSTIIIDYWQVLNVELLFSNEGIIMELYA